MRKCHVYFYSINIMSIYNAVPSHNLLGLLCLTLTSVEMKVRESEMFSVLYHNFGAL